MKESFLKDQFESKWVRHWKKLLDVTEPLTMFGYLSIEGEAIQDFLEKYPEFFQVYFEQLGQKLIGYHTKI